MWVIYRNNPKVGYYTGWPGSDAWSEEIDVARHYRRCPTRAATRVLGNCLQVVSSSNDNDDHEPPPTSDSRF